MILSLNFSLAYLIGFGIGSSSLSADELEDICTSKLLLIIYKTKKGNRSELKKKLTD